jgi:hypothetical protein
MPRSAAQKAKRKVKRKAAKAKKLAKVVTAVATGLGGSGKYRPAKLRGSGAYSLSDAVNAVKDVATYEAKTGVGKGVSNVAEGLASAFGIPGAKHLGSAAGWFTKLLGFGDYEIENNSLMGMQNGVQRTPFGRSGMRTNPVPYFQSSEIGSDITFAHREFCFDVMSSINFANTELPINPGNPILFPWLSKLALLYEEFQFLGLVFEYKTTSATAVGTVSSAMGAVVMATDYDCYDANYHTKRAIEAAEFSVSGAPYETFMHPVECDPKRNNSRNFFIVNGITNASSAPGDQRNSVLGNFSIARVGQQADNTAIGELWVTYHVKLSRPILESDADSGSFSQHIAGVASPGGVIAGTLNTCNTTGFTVQWNGVSATGSTITLGANAANLIKGQYLIALYSRANSAAAYANPPTVGTVTALGSTSYNLHMYNPVTGALNGLAANSAHAGATSYESPYMSASNFIIAKFNALGDGINLWVPCHSTVTAYVDVYIVPWNDSVIAPVSGKDEVNDRIDDLQKKIDSLLANKVIIVDEASSSSTSNTVDLSRLPMYRAVRPST